MKLSLPKKSGCGAYVTHLPAPAIATAPWALWVTPVIDKVWPGSGSLSLDRTVMVLGPLSSKTVVVSSPACGVQSMTSEAVPSLLSTAPSSAVYLKLAVPQKPVAGVNVNPPDGARFTAPPIGTPDSTAVRLFMP